MIFFSGGNFGELRVYYSTEMLTAAPGGIANVFDYYSQPQQGSRGITGERVDVPTGSDPTAVNYFLQLFLCEAFKEKGGKGAKILHKFRKMHGFKVGYFNICVHSDLFMLVRGWKMQAGVLITLCDRYKI